jgi:hypothetical protein
MLVLGIIDNVAKKTEFSIFLNFKVRCIFTRLTRRIATILLKTDITLRNFILSRYKINILQHLLINKLVLGFKGGINN